MTPERTLFGIGFLVDTNCVNARQKITAMNRLELLAAEEIIELITARTAQLEMAAGNSDDRRRKTYSFIASFSEITTQDERVQLNRIATILYPAGVTTQNQQNDIDIVFNAGKYLRQLITNDGGSRTQPGGILGNRKRLAGIGINVLTPEEALSRVEAAIQARDRYAREWSIHNNMTLPYWVGKD